MDISDPSWITYESFINLLTPYRITQGGDYLQECSLSFLWKKMIWILRFMLLGLSFRWEGCLCPKRQRPTSTRWDRDLKRPLKNRKQTLHFLQSICGRKQSLVKREDLKYRAHSIKLKSTIIFFSRDSQSLSMIFEK